MREDVILEDKKWNTHLSNSAQVGGIETSILDNGPGKGTRVAWVNTGAGLRYKIVTDRAMDIAEAFYNQHSLAWLSHLGVRGPQPFSNQGTDWLKNFGGGLFVTCGLDHIGGPESDEFGSRGLHGPISNIAAEIESIVQPDLSMGKLNMSIVGSIKQTQPLGQQFELKRTISGTLGKSIIWIHDEVVNHGNTPAPHMMLYHFNFGWPLIDEGTQIIWQGKWKSRETGANNKIFKEGNDFRKCPDPLEDHSGGGEEAAFIDVDADSSGQCICGLFNAKLGIAVTLKFQKNQLPWLTNWQHWGKGEYVTGLEPGTNTPTGQSSARNKKELLYIAPGERKIYDLEIEVLNNEDKIQEFLKKVNY